MTVRLYRISAGLLLGLAVIGCAGRERIPNDRTLGASAEYTDELRRATRQTEFFDGFDVHAQVFATLVHDRFEAAYLREFADVYGPAHPLRPLRGDDRLTLIVAMSADNEKLARLEAFGTLWSVRFASGTTAPVEPDIVEVLPNDPLYLRYFFPYWNPWRNVFRMRFPLPASTSAGSLDLRGPAGHISLNW